MSWTDHELGMHRPISRRDFLNGAAMAIGSVMTPHAFAGTSEEAQNRAGYDPPAALGLRGSHVGAFEIAHQLRDRKFWTTAGTPENTGEIYDLVVVGGGISGLSAARFFHRIAGRSARVLVLENHDDIGGHAKRNEFQVDKTFLLGYGGTYSIESPAPYSRVARRFIRDLGIDVPSYPRHLDEKPFDSLGLKKRYFFDKETYGSDRLVLRPENWDDEQGWNEFSAHAPMTATAKSDLARLCGLKEDLLPGLTSDEKKARLARMSYADYLRTMVKVDPEVLQLLDPEHKDLYGVGYDAISAQDAWGLGMPGFAGLQLRPGAGPGMGRDAIPNKEAKEYFFHFPDGNASIARLLVRSLIPAAVPGNSAEDVVSARLHYDNLDRPGQATRIRLNSTVVRVRHVGEMSTAHEVEIAYVQGGRLCTVKASHCILACWHQVIPLLASELPPDQAASLRSAEKVPLVYTNVALRDWQSFARLKTRSITAPGSYFSQFGLDQRVSVGNYHCTKRPDQPIVVTMERYPCSPGLPARSQHKAGRFDLYGTSFATFERNLRELLARSLGPGGLDPADDIVGITVNRWPHGYAYQYNSLWDPFWLQGGPLPCESARKPFGRIAIANADADAYAYTDCAIDQAYRAVRDLHLQNITDPT
jgi:spermidine dehydrogenase